MWNNQSSRHSWKSLGLPVWELRIVWEAQISSWVSQWHQIWPMSCLAHKKVVSAAVRDVQTDIGKRRGFPTSLWLVCVCVCVLGWQKWSVGPREQKQMVLGNKLLTPQPCWSIPGVSPPLRLCPLPLLIPFLPFCQVFLLPSPCTWLSSHGLQSQGQIHSLLNTFQLKVTCKRCCIFIFHPRLKWWSLCVSNVWNTEYLALCLLSSYYLLWWISCRLIKGLCCGKTHLVGGISDVRPCVTSQMDIFS